MSHSVVLLRDRVVRPSLGCQPGGRLASARGGPFCPGRRDQVLRDPHDGGSLAGNDSMDASVTASLCSSSAPVGVMRCCSPGNVGCACGAAVWSVAPLCALDAPAT